jgi:hypothetical protein
LARSIEKFYTSPAMLQQIAEYIKTEWSVLKNAPFTFVTLSVLWLGAGIGVGMFYYGGQIALLHEQIESKTEEIGRYRVALGVDPTSKGILVELTNQELKAKSATVVLNLRAFCSELHRKGDEIQAELNAKKMDEKAAYDQKPAFDKRLSDNFVTGFRADTFNVDNELRRRLGPAAVNSIVGVSPSLVADNGAPLDILTITISGSSPGFMVEFTCTLADSIEQMAKLLPPNQ